MEKDCKICGLKIILSDTNLYVVLTEKGVNRINNAKKRTGNIYWRTCTYCLPS